MQFRDPVAAYIAANHLEAHLICRTLQEAGIEASVISDTSQIERLAVIYRPQVWIERADIERAGPVLAAFEPRVDSENSAASVVTIDAVCDECGETTTFPASEKGSVQNCRRCGAFVDVGETASIDIWQSMTNAASDDFEADEAEDDRREDE